MNQYFWCLLCARLRNRRLVALHATREISSTCGNKRQLVAIAENFNLLSCRSPDELIMDKTIRLFSTPASYDDDVLDLPFTYDIDQWTNKILAQRYGKFWQESELLFDSWLKKSNEHLLINIEGFIDDTLKSRKNDYFFDAPETINVATVVLGIQTSDHIPTINMIEKRITEKYSELSIIRLPADLDKKSHLINILEEAGSQKYTFVIVERIETFKHQLLESLILMLSDALRSGQTDSAIIMICMSGSWRNIMQTLPADNMNRIGKVVQLVKDPRGFLEKLPLELLKGTHDDFKIVPHCCFLIDNDFFERNASLDNLKYLYQYAVFEHLSRPVSLLASSADVLKKLPKTKLLELLRRVPSVKKISLKSINPVEFCTRMCAEINQNHKYIFNQITYYFNLLRDTTRNNFPSHIQDLYFELFKYNDLGESSDMYNVIERLKHCPPDRVLARINSSVENYLDHPEGARYRDLDIFITLRTFELKLNEADDKTAIILDFIKLLHKHVGNLKNPLKFPLHEAVYFDKSLLLRRQALPSTRREALTDFTDESTNFGILYKMIHGSTENISISDLYGDFKAKLEIENEVIVKAMFLDLVRTMEHHGLIKSDSRSSQRGFIKRLTWL